MIVIFDSWSHEIEGLRVPWCRLLKDDEAKLIKYLTVAWIPFRLIHRYVSSNRRLQEFEDCGYQNVYNDDTFLACGDNVLAYAIRRNLQLDNGDDDAFWSFVDLLRSKNNHQLASVADVYPQVRLHPNTELAALLVWP